MKKLQEKKIENLRLSKKNIINKTRNYKKTLQIIQMYFVTRKQKNIIMKISHWTEILKDYVNKERPSGKTGSKLVTFIKENKKEIRKMDIYLNREVQTEEERDSIKNSHDNSSTNSLYPPNHWGLT